MLNNNLHLQSPISEREKKSMIHQFTIIFNLISKELLEPLIFSIKLKKIIEETNDTQNGIKEKFYKTCPGQICGEKEIEKTNLRGTTQEGLSVSAAGSLSNSTQASIFKIEK